MRSSTGNGSAAGPALKLKARFVRVTAVVVLTLLETFRRNLRRFPSDDKSGGPLPRIAEAASAQRTPPEFEIAGRIQAACKDCVTRATAAKGCSLPRRLPLARGFRTGRPRSGFCPRPRRGRGPSYCCPRE